MTFKSAWLEDQMILELNESHDIDTLEYQQMFPASQPCLLRS